MTLKIKKVFITRVLVRHFFMTLRLFLFGNVGIRLLRRAFAASLFYDGRGTWKNGHWSFVIGHWGKEKKMGYRKLNKEY